MVREDWKEKRMGNISTEGREISVAAAARIVWLRKRGLCFGGGGSLMYNPSQRPRHFLIRSKRNGRSAVGSLNTNRVGSK